MSTALSKALDFVTVWERSESAEEVAQSLGVSIAAVTARASAYRSKGIKLRKFHGNVLTSLDIAKINSTIERIHKKA